MKMTSKTEGVTSLEKGIEKLTQIAAGPLLATYYEASNWQEAIGLATRRRGFESRATGGRSNEAAYPYRHFDGDASTLRC